MIESVHRQLGAELTAGVWLRLWCLIYTVDAKKLISKLCLLCFSAHATDLGNSRTQPQWCLHSLVFTIFFFFELLLADLITQELIWKRVTSYGISVYAHLSSHCL